jgi:hypothetical protein
MANFPRKRAIPDDTLTAWAQQGALGASKRTHEAVRAAVDAYSWPPEASHTAYLQGSYRNYTNIRDDSDVDIVAELHFPFSPDLAILSQPEQAAFRAYHADNPQLDWSDFRQHVLTALIGGFGASAIREDARAIIVLGDSNGLNAKVSWAVYIGCMVWTFFAPGQVIESDPTATAFSDICLACGGDNRPDTIVTERTLTRGYYKCRLPHPSGELPAWWTDWESSEVVDRHVIFTPDLVGGGNTWSTVPLDRKWGDEVSDLFWELRPNEAGDP